MNAFQQPAANGIFLQPAPPVVPQIQIAAFMDGQFEMEGYDWGFDYYFAHQNIEPARPQGRLGRMRELWTRVISFFACYLKI
ncbi:hypothetical protein NLI96_g12196 [Meripilus lineatus]|uniref:Uncharacterized protein n=1 Tax=Meripilus lineatus TaxID=2056292 RepID=A0AAD5YCN4_9APHY|nr:hypothetical protein NLI96_g12196 [Physisporinus lineatus]